MGGIYMQPPQPTLPVNKVGVGAWWGCYPQGPIQGSF